MERQPTKYICRAQYVQHRLAILIEEEYGERELNWFHLLYELMKVRDDNFLSELIKLRDEPSCMETEYVCSWDFIHDKIEEYIGKAPSSQLVDSVLELICL